MDKIDITFMGILIVMWIISLLVSICSVLPPRKNNNVKKKIEKYNG